MSGGILYQGEKNTLRFKEVGNEYLVLQHNKLENKQIKGNKNRITVFS
jgi:hypothetical protein